MNGPVLVTGFQAFGGDPDNPSARVTARLDGTEVAGAPVRTAVLPVVTASVGAALRQALDAVRPRAVVALGVAPGRTAPALERVAINVRDFPLPDNEGEQPTGEPVDPGGPAAYFSGLPVKAILAAWKEERLPGYLSNTAGTYVCNQVFYLLGRWWSGSGRPFGLIHLPADPGMAASAGERVPPPSMSTDSMLACVRRALEVTLDHTGPDLDLPAGAVS